MVLCGCWSGFSTRRLSTAHHTNLMCKLLVTLMSNSPNPPNTHNTTTTHNNRPYMLQQCVATQQQ